MTVEELDQLCATLRAQALLAGCPNIVIALTDTPEGNNFRFYVGYNGNRIILQGLAVEAQRMVNASGNAAGFSAPAILAPAAPGGGAPGASVGSVGNDGQPNS